VIEILADLISNVEMALLIWLQAFLVVDNDLGHLIAVVAATVLAENLAANLTGRNALWI